MNLEARPWLVDFHAAFALDSFPFFWVFLLGLFLEFSMSWHLGFPLGLFLVFSEFQGQGLGRFLSDWAGQFSSCVFFRPTDPSRSVLGSGWSLSFVCLLVFLFLFLFLFFPILPSPHTQCWVMVRVIGPLN